MNIWFVEVLLPQQFSAYSVAGMVQQHSSASRSSCGLAPVPSLEHP